MIFREPISEIVSKKKVCNLFKVTFHTENDADEISYFSLDLEVGIPTEIDV